MVMAISDASKIVLPGFALECFGGNALQQLLETLFGMTNFLLLGTFLGNFFLFRVGMTGVFSLILMVGSGNAGLPPTNRDLMGMVRRKEFREDLFYRLNVFPICVPSLLQSKRSHLPPVSCLVVAGV